MAYEDLSSFDMDRVLSVDGLKLAVDDFVKHEIRWDLKFFAELEWRIRACLN